MKKILWLFIIGFVLCSCSTEKSDEKPIATGNIYGVITIKSTAELMRATGVDLYQNNTLLLKTVTYDDGHYEFTDLKVGTYELRVAVDGYVDAKSNVIVEAGRTARADIQLTEIETVYGNR